MAAGAGSFSDAIETAKEMVKVLREKEKADVVVGGHSHTELQEAIIVNGRTPVVQSGKESRSLGELVITVDGDKLTVESCRLHPVDDAVAVSISRWQWRPTICPTPSSTSLPAPHLPTSSPAHFETPPKRNIGLNANGAMRAGFTRGTSGVQTVYDVSAVAPLGAGVVDPTAGNALVTGWFTGRELENRLEFLLVDNPAHPGEYFPRTSSMKFRYDQSRWPWARRQDERPDKPATCSAPAKIFRLALAQSQGTRFRRLAQPRVCAGLRAAQPDHWLKPRTP
jgi:5'-nucleotidase/UDP-sugar diphosphatase